MSKEHKDPMMRLLESLLGGETEEQKEDTPPTDTKGFESLVTPREYEAIVAVKEAMEHYIEVHNECVIENAKNGRILEPYGNIQYMFLSSIVEDAMEDIGAMYAIHCLDKDEIDEMVKEAGAPDVKDLERKIVFEMMAKKLKG